MKRLAIFLVGLMLLNSLAFAEGTKILGFGKHLKFGDVAVGDSVTRELTLYNRGDADLTISELYFHESLDGVYTGNFSGVIPANGEQNVTITFSPTSNALSQGSVYVVSDKTNRGDSSRSLTGQGVGVDIGVTRKLGFGKHLKFGDVSIGDSETRELTLYNRGNADLTISELYFHENLHGVYSGNFSGTIPPNGEQNVTITFSPISDTFSQGLVYIVSDKTNRGDSSRLLTGQGIDDSDSDTDTGGDGCDESTALTKGELRDMIVQGRDVTGVNTCMITDMSNLFIGQSHFNQDISRWDTSKVTDMSYMFYYAEDFNQSIGDWNVSSVTNMSFLFTGAKSFNQPIGDWDVSSVTSMKRAFSHTESFNQPIGNWDVSSVTNMSKMFYYAKSFDQPIGGWDVSNVTNMSWMFYYARGFNQNIKNWDVANVLTHENFATYSILQDNYNPFAVNLSRGLTGIYYGMDRHIANISQFRDMIDNDEANTTATFIATDLDYGYGTGTVSLGDNLQRHFLNSDASSLSNDPVDTANGGINLLGKIYLDAGTYNFRVLSDDGYQIKIDGVSVAEIDYNQSPTTTTHSSFVIADDGYHDIDIVWWDQGGEYVFMVELSSDNGASYSVLDSDSLFHSGS